MDTIFAGVERGAIFKSDDGGITWKRSASGLNPEASVTDIIFDPTNPGTIYLADQLSGVYRSVDGGNTWALINKGLSSRAVNALAISADGMHLYAATEGNGIYRMDINNQPPPPAQTRPTPNPTIVNLPVTPGSSPQVLTAATPTYVYQYQPGETPTAIPKANPAVCGAGVVIPFGLLGLILWHASRKKG